MMVQNFEQYQPKFREWLQCIHAKDGDRVRLTEYMSWVRKEWDKANERS